MSPEKAEAAGGALFLGLPTFDFLVGVLDNYGRFDLLLALHEHLPKWLTNPAMLFVCMFVGFALLHQAHKEQMKRIAANFHKGLVDASGEKVVMAEKSPWLKPVVLVFVLLVIAVPIISTAYTLSYKGTPPDFQVTSLKPPPICKTADCFPRGPKPALAKPLQTVIYAPGGIPIMGNKGTINNPVVNNLGPVQRHLSAATKAELRDCLRQNPGHFSIAALSGNNEAYVYAQDWRDVFLSARWTIEHSDIPIEMFEIGGGMWTGVRIMAHDASPIDGKTGFAVGSPEETAFKCLSVRNDIPGGGGFVGYKDRVTGSIFISVSAEQ